MKTGDSPTCITSLVNQLFSMSSPVSLTSMEYSGDSLRDVAISFTVIEVLAVSLRFLSLFMSKKTLGMDDILAIPGLLCCLGLNTLVLRTLSCPRNQR
jgi:hypothetical protein